jgi:hypothetical protein
MVSEVYVKSDTIEPPGWTVPLEVPLIYCARHRPPFDPASSRRYDCRSSNPGAVRFFPTGRTVAERGEAKAQRREVRLATGAAVP